MKYNKKIVKHICGLISKDTYTIAEICASVGISESCYYKWQAENVEFTESIARARDQFDETLVKEAKNALRKLVNGYEVEEKSTVFQNDKDGKPKIKEQKVVKKFFQPNASSVEYVLNNKASAEFKNRQSNEVTGKDGVPLFPDIKVEIIDKREEVENTDDKDLQPG